MSALRIFSLCVLGALAPIRTMVHPGEVPQSKIVPDTSNDAFIAGPRYMYLPKGAFLLVRKGDQFGAFRFIDINPIGPDSHGTATYESYFLSTGARSFVNGQLVRRSGEIRFGHHWVVSHTIQGQSRQAKLWVGPWWFGCGSLHLVNMGEHFDEKSDGFQFAPTSATKIEEIDFSDSRLRWLSYDDNSSIHLPISGLAK